MFFVIFVAGILFYTVIFAEVKVHSANLEANGKTQAKKDDDEMKKFLEELLTDGFVKIAYGDPEFKPIYVNEHHKKQHGQRTYRL